MFNAFQKKQTGPLSQHEPATSLCFVGTPLAQPSSLAGWQVAWPS